VVMDKPYTGYSFILDTAEPVSGATLAPPNENVAPISVDFFCGDSLAEVALWVSNNDITFFPTGITDSGSTGTLDYFPIGDGVYYFKTIATDLAGNLEDKTGLPHETMTTFDMTAPASFVLAELADYNPGDTIDVPFYCYDEFDPNPTIHLWYQYNDGGGWSAWTDSGLAIGCTAESFSFFPTDGAGSYRFYTVAEDLLGNLEDPPSAPDYDSHELVVDDTPPDPIIVYDGFDAIDDDYWLALDYLAANWTASDDAESEIDRYDYAIGTAPGANDIVDWTDNAILTIMTAAGLSLADGQVLYVSVRAYNGAGPTTAAAAESTGEGASPW